MKPYRFLQRYSRQVLFPVPRRQMRGWHCTAWWRGTAGRYLQYHTGEERMMLYRPWRGTTGRCNFLCRTGRRPEQNSIPTAYRSTIDRQRWCSADDMQQHKTWATEISDSAVGFFVFKKGGKPAFKDDDEMWRNMEINLDEMWRKVEIRWEETNLRNWLKSH